MLSLFSSTFSRHLLVYWFSIMISAMLNILQVAANIENLKLLKNVSNLNFKKFISSHKNSSKKD
jgi:hypothetical protein